MNEFARFMRPNGSGANALARLDAMSRHYAMQPADDQRMLRGGMIGPQHGPGFRYGAGVDPYRPVVPNADGSHSSELSITIDGTPLNDGQPTNIPTMWDGKQLSDDEAIARAIQSGWQFPAFRTIEDAVKAAGERTEGLGRANVRPRR